MELGCNKLTCLEPDSETFVLGTKKTNSFELAFLLETFRIDARLGHI